MSVPARLQPAVVDYLDPLATMSPHVFALLVPISPAAYADAVQQRQAGNLTVNPLSVALAMQTDFALVGFTGEFVTLRDVWSGRRYTGFMPADLTRYLARFEAGKPMLEEHI